MSEALPEARVSACQSGEEQKERNHGEKLLQPDPTLSSDTGKGRENGERTAPARDGWELAQNNSWVLTQ